MSAQAEERKSTADPNTKVEDYLRDGKVEKAKKFLEAHDREYVHQDGSNTATKTLETGKAEVAAANTQGILNNLNDNGLFSLTAWDKWGEENVHSIFLTWEWEVVNRSGNRLDESAAISWSETAYRPVADTDTCHIEYPSSVNEDDVINTEVHQHGYKIEFPLLLDRLGGNNNGSMSIDVEVRDSIENGTTLYGEYIHTWERAGWAGNLSFDLPGPASLEPATSSVRYGDWDEQIEENYYP